MGNHAAVLKSKRPRQPHRGVLASRPQRATTHGNHIKWPRLAKPPPIASRGADITASRPRNDPSGSTPRPYRRTSRKRSVKPVECVPSSSNGTTGNDRYYQFVRIDSQRIGYRLDRCTRRRIVPRDHPRYYARRYTQLPRKFALRPRGRTSIEQATDVERKLAC